MAKLMHADKFCSLENDFSDKEIVIIGAGMSGLSCAFHLHALGFKNVTILEGRNRIGGRIHTIEHDSKPLELGAQWIHGQVGNPIHELASKNNLTDPDAPDYMEELIKFPNCNQEEKNTFVDAFMFLQEQLEHNTSNMSADIVMWDRFEKWVMKEKDIKCDINSFYGWYTNFLCELIGCENLDLVSSSLLSGYLSYPGRHTVELKFGYVKVLNLLLTGIPKEWIIKNKTVTQIDWSHCESSEIPMIGKQTGHKQSLIFCDDGSSYHADHVVITLPLGCLKAHAETLFIPKLPHRKLVAINSIGFGSVNKIYLEFEHPFWQATDIFPVMFFDHQKDKGLMSGDHPWYKNINRFAYVAQQPNMLCAWVTGTGSVLMEKLSTEEIIDDCLKVLKSILKKSDLPQPLHVTISKWSSDPFSHGSYSYPTMDCEKQFTSPMDLAEPIFITLDNEKHLALSFAGEATHLYCYGTVHAAYDTGIREANRIYSFHHSSVKILPPASCLKKANVVVIGAGTAGLACTQRLLSFGFKNIVVLEALDRIGGRIHTEQHGPFVIELGAQWIHGEDGNALYQYCKNHDLLDNINMCIVNEGKGLFCTSRGNIIPEFLVDEVLVKLTKIKDSITEAGYKHTDEPLSIVDVFHNQFHQYISSCTDIEEIKSLKWAIFKWFLKFEVIDNACDDLHDITTVGYCEWEECPGYFYTNVKSGFHSFIKSLVKDVSPGVIHIAKPVKCIHWNAEVDCKSDSLAKVDEEIAIECVNGDFYYANIVVLTTSMGFLKSQMCTFFNPSLPEKKRTAINKIGFGTINKIFLEFEEPFWASDILGYQLLWEDDVDPQQILKPENFWATGITGFDRVRGQPNMLVAWVGGLKSKYLENLTDDDIASTCVFLLKKFLNRTDIPIPIKIVRSSWYNNAYMKGAYSYRPDEFYRSGCTVADLKEPLSTKYLLADNVALDIPSVLFAGEATSDCLFASVHGALSSGWDAASEVQKCFSQLDSVKMK